LAPTRSTPAAQLAAFIGRFESSIAATIRGARTKLRRRFPTAVELVYDNYNFFVIGYCATPRASDCVVSLVASAKGVALSFYYGAGLPDPSGILLGSGRQNRFVRLTSATTLDDPAVRALIDAAVGVARTPLPPTGRGKLVIQSVSVKHRPRQVSSARLRARDA